MANPTYNGHDDLEARYAKIAATITSRTHGEAISAIVRCGDHPELSTTDIKLIRSFIQDSSKPQPAMYKEVWGSASVEAAEN